MVPSWIFFRVDTMSLAPAAISLSWRLSPVSSSSMGTISFSSISPVSMPSSIIMVVTPVSFSPSITAHWIGAAPRYLGSRDAWTLTHPRGGISSTSFVRIWPKATTTITSGFSSLRTWTNSGVRTFKG